MFLERLSQTKLYYVGVCAALLAVTIALTVWWGPYPHEHLFELLSSYQQPLSLAFVESKQPLLAVLLAQFGPHGQLLLPLGMAALGRWLLALAFWFLIRPKTPTPLNHLIALVTTLLLALHPALATSAGSGYSWIAAASLALVAQQHKKRDWQSALLTAALFAAWFDWQSAILVWLILLYRLGTQRTFLPLTTLVALAGSAGTIWLAVSNGVGLNVGGVSAETLSILQQYAYESDFYLLFVPLLLIGLYYARAQPYVLIWLGWALLMLLTQPSVGQLLCAVTAVWLIAVALQALSSWLQQQTEVSWPTTFPQLFLGLVGACGVVACLMSLRLRHQLRPVAQYDAEDQALAFLDSAENNPQSYAASPRLAWRFNQPTYLWQNNVEADLQALIAAPPDTLVLPVSLWQRELSNLVWVRQQFRPITEVGNADQSVLIMQRIALSTDLAPAITLPVTTTFGYNLESIQIAPQTIDAGGAVDIVLNWRAEDTVTPFGSVLNITHPVDGTNYAQIDLVTPYNVSNSLIAAGQIVPTAYQLTTVPEIPIGAYPLKLLTHAPGTTAREPLIRAGEDNVLDQVTLGYIAVPWQGEISGTAIGGSYADDIRLANADIRGDVVAGGTLDVILYWQSDATPSENYTIYLHFLGSDGSFITGSDSVPFAGRYPTRGWHAGDTIPSEHSLTLPADLPLGAYQMKAGLYLPQTGERLLATAADGAQPPDRSLLLGEFELK